MVFTLNAVMFDFVVLSVIAQEDSYGYQLSQVIKEVSNTQDSTLYPVLRRLQENRYLKTYDRQFQGRNRKYYSITEEGKKQYQFLFSEWEKFTGLMDKIVSGGEQK